MSIAMSKPVLPSIKKERLPSLSGILSQTIELPPLSSLLNTTDSSYTTQSETSKALSSSSQPTSPSLTANSLSSTDPFSHKITTNEQPNEQTKLAQPTTLSMKTPVRLPSFDSLQFETRSVKPVIQHSKSLSTSVPSMASLTTPAPILSLPTPVSRQPGQAVKNEGLEQTSSSTTQSDSQHSPLVEKRSFAFISHSPSTFPSHEPTIDDAQLARRKRRRTSPCELAILQAEFTKGQTPNRARRNEIASKVNMTEKAVQIWFQNKRQATRRQSSSEREVHHLEPVYPTHIPQQPGPIMLEATPYRQQPMAFTSPFPQPQNLAQPQPQPLTQTEVQPLEQPQQTSSPQRDIASSPPHQQSSSSPDRSTTTVLITPSRPPRVKKDSPGGTTMTFRLTSEKTTPGKTMTPMMQSTRQRQKPTMKVNYQPTSSSPIDKENFSPQSSPVKVKQELKQLQSPKRVPLGQLSFNVGNKPRDNEAVSNLLNLQQGK